MFGIQTKPSLYRDFALLSALIIFVLFIVSIWVSYETYQEHSKDIIKQLENETVRIDRALIIEIERSSYLLESLGRQISNLGTDNLHGIERLFDSFDISGYPQTNEFFWVDANQNIVVSSHKGVLEKPSNVSDRDYMKKAITTPWYIHIGQPIEGRVSEKWVMPLAIGLTDEQNQFKGAVVVSIDIAALKDEIGNMIEKDSIRIAITNTAFTLLTEVSGEKDFFARHFDTNLLAKTDFSTHTKGVYSQANLFDTDTIYAYYEKSTQYPYIIFVGYNPNISQADIQGILVPRLLQIIIITVFLVLILWTVRKRIIHPVIELTQQTAHIIRGENFHYTSDDGPIEIEHLAEEITRISDYIAERKRIERELSAKNADLLKVRESAEMTNTIKAQFFEQVGTSLMQPATIIMEYAESLKNELFGPLGSPKYSEVSDKMYQQALQIIELLNDVLAISRAESGLLALDEERVELPLIVKKCVRLMHDRSRFQAVEIIQDFDDDLPLIMADELRIKQLLLNLLTGAAAQLTPGDVIRLRINHRREGVVIRLEYVLPDFIDDDMDEPPLVIGMPSAFGGNNAASGDHGTSAGLGFALNQLIVAMHGGTIDVRTNADRKVTLTVTFPEGRIAHQAI